MIQINLSEAKAHLGSYLAKVAQGEVVVVCERNKPVAEIRALPSVPAVSRIVVGVAKGEFVVPDDFNEPLPDFEQNFYGEKGTE